MDCTWVSSVYLLTCVNSQMIPQMFAKSGTNRSRLFEALSEMSRYSFSGSKMGFVVYTLVTGVTQRQGLECDTLHGCTI